MSYGSKPVHPFEHAYNGGTISAEGITLREAFAMAAMQGLCAALHDDRVRALLVQEADLRGVEPKDRLVAAAAEYADALLSALEPQP